MRELAVDAAPVAGRAGEQRRFPEQSLGQLGQEALQPGTFQDATADRVHHSHRAAVLCLDQAGHAEPRVGAQIERVGVGGIDAAKDHVDAFERTQRAHPQSAVTNHQVGALDQRETQQRGEIRLIEGGFGVNARAQDDDHRILNAVGCRVDQRQPQRLSKWRRRPRSHLLVEVGQCLRKHPPVSERISGAGGGLGPIGVHLEAAVGAPADIAGMHEELVVSRHLDSIGGPDVTGMGEQQFRWQHALDERASVAVHVGQHGVEHPGSLHQSGFEHVPVVSGHHQRQRVQAPRSRLVVTIGDGLFGGIDTGVSDVVVVHQPAYRGVQPAHAGPSAITDRVGEVGPRRADVSDLVEELVVADNRPLKRGWAQVEQRLLGTRGAISGQQPVDVGAVAKRCRRIVRM